MRLSLAYSPAAAFMAPPAFTNVQWSRSCCSTGAKTAPQPTAPERLEPQPCLRQRITRERHAAPVNTQRHRSSQAPPSEPIMMYEVTAGSRQHGSQPTSNCAQSGTTCAPLKLSFTAHAGRKKGRRQLAGHNLTTVRTTDLPPVRRLTNEDTIPLDLTSE